MLPLVEFPDIVQHYAPFFKDVFSAEALIEFERYISGLIVSENKTVEGINRLFIHESRNQSSLNRLLTESPVRLEALNQARLDMLASQPGARMKLKGVFSVDDTLLSHVGQEFEKITKLWDHVLGTYVWAHDLVTLHYSDDQTDYPVLFQLWEPVELEKLEQGLRAAHIPIKTSKEALKESAPQKWRSYLIHLWQRQQKAYPKIQELYDTKLVIAKKLLEQWVKTHPKEQRPVTFDSWFTQPTFCQFLDQTLHLPYVGTLKEDDQVNLETGLLSLRDFAERLHREHQAALQGQGQPIFRKITISYKGQSETYYSYCKTHSIHNFGRQRLVINYDRADLSDKPNFYMSNRLYWNAGGITRIRRHRWPVEVYHQQGKEEGLDKYQLRGFDAIQRHLALVAVVYSMLRAAQHDPALQEKLQRQLQVTLEQGTADLRRASQAQALWVLALFISAGLAQGQTLQKIMAPMIQAMCRS
jgi:hypothetical protein